MKIPSFWLLACLLGAVAVALAGCSLDWTVVAKDAGRAPDAAVSAPVDASREVRATVDAGRVDAEASSGAAYDAGPYGDDAGLRADDAGRDPSATRAEDDAGLVPTPDAAVAADPLRASCALLLHLDEPGWDGARADAHDDSGLATHGTVRGSVPTSIAGQFGGAISLAGMSWVEVADAPSLRASSALTVSVWFYLDTLPDMRWPGLVNKRSAFNVDSSFAVFIAADGHLNVDVDGEESRFASQALVTTQHWTHVAFVFDGSLPMAERVRLYIDGALDVVALEPSAVIPPYTSSLVVGNLVNGGDTFTGRIDEVALWTRALSASEIAALHQAPVR